MTGSQTSQAVTLRARCLLLIEPGQFFGSQGLRMGRSAGGTGQLGPEAEGPWRLGPGVASVGEKADSKEEALPHPSPHRPEPKVQVPQAQSPGLFLIWELDFISQIL